jgi:Transglycosylase-like domain
MQKTACPHQRIHLEPTGFPTLPRRSKMRKHPLIALIAFAFLAISTFVGAASAGNINSVPVRATSHLSHREAGLSPSRPRADNLHWLAATARERAAASQASELLVSQHDSMFWHSRAGDLAAMHDGFRPMNGLLPSAWRAMVLRAAQAAAARAAAARAASAIQQAQTQATTTTQATIPPSVTTTTQPTVATQPPPPPSSKGGDLGGVWLQLRLCESGNNYGENTGNGYYGAYQFSLSTWESIGYSGLPSNAPPAVQDQAAEKLQALAGWGQWPACSAELGL